MASVAGVCVTDLNIIFKLEHRLILKTDESDAGV